MPAPPPTLPQVALIGIHGYAQAYVELLRTAYHQGRLEVVAATVVESQLEMQAVQDLRSWGARIYTSYEAMFAQERGRIDLCLIPTGIQWHARMTIAALEAGANVLVEKPLSGSLEDAAAMLASERLNGRWIAVGFQDIYTAEARWLKQELVSGAIGKILDVRMIGIWPRPRNYFFRNKWAGRLKSEGGAALDSVLNNAFSHFVNLSLYFAGRDLRSFADVEVDEADLLQAHAIESFDTAVVRAHSAAGTRFWLGATHASDTKREPEIHLYGERGEAHWLHDRHCELRITGEEAIVKPTPGPVDTRFQMFDAVMEKLSDPAYPVCTARQAFAHTRLICSLQRDFSIHRIAEAEIDWHRLGDDADMVPSVRGIDAALDQAMTTDRSLLSVRPYQLAELVTP